jgi:hypothetical protein
MQPPPSPPQAQQPQQPQQPRHGTPSAEKTAMRQNGHAPSLPTGDLAHRGSEPHERMPFPAQSGQAPRAATRAPGGADGDAVREGDATAHANGTRSLAGGAEPPREPLAQRERIAEARREPPHVPDDTFRDAEDGQNPAAQAVVRPRPERFVVAERQPRERGERYQHIPGTPDVRGDVGPLVDELHALFERDRAVASQGSTARCGVCYFHFSLVELEYREAEGHYVCPNCAKALGRGRIVMVRRQQRT